jgi:hypothetical protein
MEKCIVLVPKEGTEFGISPNGVISLSDLESVHIGNKTDVFASASYNISDVFVVYFSEETDKHKQYPVSSILNN